MAYFHTDDKHVSQSKFADIPAIGDIGKFIQAPCSVESRSTGSISQISSQYSKSLREGDLITGIINITNERAHMVPAIQDASCSDEKEALEEYLLSLQIIPHKYQEEWNLNHASNTTWLSPFFHYHHNTYATILIAPSAEDSKWIRLLLNDDNFQRLEYLKKHGYDSGRSQKTDWFKYATGKYELIVLLPSQFSSDGFPVMIKHPITQSPTAFYTSSDGFLHEGSPTGPRLPAFSSRGDVGCDVTLNPILVNLAAAIRLRHLDQQIPGWRNALHVEALEVLTEVEELYKTVVFVPWKLPSTSIKSSPQSSGTGVQPTMRREDAEKLMHIDFEDIPDLDGDYNPHYHVDLGSNLGVMTSQEKMEKFLNTSQ